MFGFWFVYLAGVFIMTLALIKHPSDDVMDIVIKILTIILWPVAIVIWLTTKGNSNDY